MACEGPSTSVPLPTVDVSSVGNKNKVWYQLGSKKVLAPLALEKEFDVVVVGGGIVGMATAREILKRYPKVSKRVSWPLRIRGWLIWPRVPGSGRRTRRIISSIR